MAKSNFIVRGGADFSGIKKELQKTQSQFASFQNSISKSVKMIGTLLGGLAVGKLVKDSTQVAMSVESAMDNISRNMGTASKSFSNWVETQSKALGMAKADAYSYGSTFSNLLSSFTAGAQDTASQTQELMKAAAIIASKTGRTYDDVANRIRSGMLGSTEAIGDLGVYVNVSMLESTKAFRKFAGDKSWAQLDYQTQQQIRLAAILEQTYDRYGDTLADTTQTKQAQFIASLKNIRLALGQAFLSVYNVVLPALTAMADAIGNVANIVSQFTQALFGMSDTAQTKATQKQTTAITDLGDATEKAGKQVKGALAGFDEITRIGGADSATEIGVTDAGISPMAVEPAVEPLAIPEPDTSWMDKISAKVEAFKKTLNFSGLQQSWANLKAALTPLSGNIGAGLQWFMDNVLAPLSTWTINELVPAFLNVLTGAIDALNSVIEVLQPLGQWLWDNFLAPIAEWTGGVIVDVLDGIAKGLTAVSDWISNNQPLVESIAIVIGSFAAAWGLVNIAIKLWNIIGVIATGITSAFGAAVAFLTSPIGIVTVAIGALIAIVVLLAKNWDKVKEAAGKVWDWIKGVWNGAADWLNTKVIQPIAKFFAGLWDGVKSGFIAFINFIIRGINKMIEGFLTPINILIKGWNASVGKVAGKISEIQISIPEIPKLASGGIAYGPSVVQVAEYVGARSNPEVIAPLDRLRDMIANIAGGDINLTANILLDDGTIVGRTTQRITRQNRLAGASLLGV